MRDKSTEIQQKTTLNVGGKLISLARPKVMGILNVTPDSFYDGGKNIHLASAVRNAGQLLAEGADFLDIGAYSSRPGAADVPQEEELARLTPLVTALVREFPEAVLSIDTFRSEVARAMIGEGAHLVNDISGGELDPAMFETVASLQVPYILMHMRGTPQTMTRLIDYEDIFDEVFQYFAARASRLNALGVRDLVLDPGFGFAKTPAQSFQLLGRLKQFSALGWPLLAGLSRKSMIYKTLETNAEGALNGTTAANTIALLNGASILRVHDVKAAVEAITLVSACGQG